MTVTLIYINWENWNVNACADADVRALHVVSLFAMYTRLWLFGDDQHVTIGVNVISKRL